MNDISVSFGFLLYDTMRLSIDCVFHIWTELNALCLMINSQIRYWLYIDKRYGYMNWLLISIISRRLTLLKFCVLIVK
jgi:hypothetical protein